MDTKNLEELLAFGRETTTLDYKAPCYWNRESFLKHIIAMANNPDVSYIVVGVGEDKKNEPRYVYEGISDPKILQSYETDTMKDQVKDYVDQAIDFEVFKPKDLKGRQYVVIRITPSLTPPVFCIKPLGDVKAGQIFIRTGIGKVQSRAIQHFTEMQRFIRLAGSAFLTNLYQDGLTCPHLFANVESATDKDLDKFKQQRGDL